MEYFRLFKLRNAGKKVKKKAAGAPTPTAKLNNFNTPEGSMRLTTAVHPYMKTRLSHGLHGVRPSDRVNVQSFLKKFIF